MKKKLFLGLAWGILSSSPAFAAREVIDLGSLKIEGAARGPEIHMIDAGRLGKTTAERFALDELARLERQLLTESADTPLVSAAGEKKP